MNEGESLKIRPFLKNFKKNLYIAKYCYSPAFTI